MEVMVAAVAPFVAELSLEIIVENVLWSAFALLSGANAYAAFEDSTSSRKNGDSENVQKTDDVVDLLRGGPARRAQIRSMQRSRRVSERCDCKKLERLIEVQNF